MNYYDKKEKVIKLINKLFWKEEESIKENLMDDILKKYGYDINCESCNGKISYGYCENCYDIEVGNLKEVINNLKEDKDGLNDKIQDLEDEIQRLYNID
jgi:thymidylate synthase